MKIKKSAGETVRAVLNQGSEFLQNQKINQPKLLAERLLQGLLECKRFELYLNADMELPAPQVERYFSFLEQRAAGVPSQYILGHAEFMDFTFKVNPSVLIPRPETEFLVEKVLQALGEKDLKERAFQILDLGTGSGNIAVSLAAYLPKASLCAVDISDEALEMARLNSMRNEVGHRIQFLRSNFFEALADRQGLPAQAAIRGSAELALPAGRKFDLIVSNPPYLSESDMREIQPELLREPEWALLAGPEGTEIIERLAREAQAFLQPGGRLFFEIGAAQGRKTAELLETYGWAYKIFKDYNGLDRVARAEKNL